jgi:hypothetical protein
MKRLLAGLLALWSVSGAAYAQPTEGAVTYNDAKYQAALTPAALPSAPATSIYVGTGAAGAAAASPFTTAFTSTYTGGTLGGVFYYGASGPTWLAPGTAGYLLQTNGAAAPTWVAPPSGGGAYTTPTAADAQTATGTTQGTALALTATVGRVTGGASTTGAVAPAFVTGVPSYFINDSSSNKYFYPPVGDTFYAIPTGGGAATALTASTTGCTTACSVIVAPGTTLTVLPLSTTLARVF